MSLDKIPYEYKIVSCCTGFNKILNVYGKYINVEKKLNHSVVELKVLKFFKNGNPIFDNFPCHFIKKGKGSKGRHNYFVRSPQLIEANGKYKIHTHHNLFCLISRAGKIQFTRFVYLKKSDKMIMYQNGKFFYGRLTRVKYFRRTNQVFRGPIPGEFERHLVLKKFKEVRYRKCLTYCVIVNCFLVKLSEPFCPPVLLDR